LFQSFVELFNSISNLYLSFKDLSDFIFRELLERVLFEYWLINLRTIERFVSPWLSLSVPQTFDDRGFCWHINLYRTILVIQEGLIYVRWRIKYLVSVRSWDGELFFFLFIATYWACIKATFMFIHLRYWWYGSIRNSLLFRFFLDNSWLDFQTIL
jgi:hypothetical protein